MKLAEVGEFGLISRIAANVTSSEGVVTGIGDDAAVTTITPGMQLLTSTDMLLEGVHFRHSWHDPYRLGRKSLAVSISDIAAMGAVPRWALLSLALPGDVPVDYIDAFTRGFLDMAEEHRVALIGGDTCSSQDRLVISVTIMGEQLPGRIVRRHGAQPGDEIWVTGTLGDAALGLRLLEGLYGSGAHPASQSLIDSLSGSEGDDYLISRLLDPSPRTGIGRLLAESGLASAMIDISDGLLADFGHIAEMSGVGGHINLADLPVSPAFRQAALQFPSFPFHLAVSGGEDYELAFTALPTHRKKIELLVKTCGIAATPVGIVTSSPEVTALHADGTSYTPPVAGFNHFNP